MVAQQRLHTGRSSQFSDDAGVSLTEALMLKSYFVNLSLMPPTVFYEDLYNFKPFDFTNLNGGSAPIVGSRAFLNMVGNPMNVGWDLGANFTKVLVIIGGMRTRNVSTGIFYAKTLPTLPEPQDGFLYDVSPQFNSANIFRNDGGATYTVINGEAGIANGGNSGNENSFAMAFYVDINAPLERAWLRSGSEMWWQIATAAFNTSIVNVIRYIGIRCNSASGFPSVAACPLGIYVG